MSTVKSARAKRTLPSLPKSSKPTNNGVFLSPTFSPKTLRKNCINSPLATREKDRSNQSRLPIRRSQSLIEITVRKSTTNGKLREQATKSNSTEFNARNSDNNHIKDIKLPTTAGETINQVKTSKYSTVNKLTTSVNKPKNEQKHRTIQELSDCIQRSNSASPVLSILTKSESVNGLDSMPGLWLEDEKSCVTVAVRVRPFNQR